MIYSLSSHLTQMGEGKREEEKTFHLQVESVIKLRVCMPSSDIISNISEAAV